MQPKPTIKKPAKAILPKVITAPAKLKLFIPKPTIPKIEEIEPVVNHKHDNDYSMYKQDLDLSVFKRADQSMQLSTPSLIPMKLPKISKQAKFRTKCYFSHFNYDDPIVYPGVENATHLHTFFGFTKTNHRTTYKTLRAAGGASTCAGGTLNKTAYWVPSMINADGKPIVPSYMKGYYKSTGHSTPVSRIQNLPDGLRIVAGNHRGNQADSNGHQIGKYTCRANDSKTRESDDPEFLHIPNCDKNSTVIMHVNFPQCWDGKNLDSPDHKSHMHYTVEGVCPSSHLIPVPQITYKVYYPFNQNGMANDTKNWRLSSDMYDWKNSKAGYSIHADWFDGWDPATKRTWLKGCYTNGGKECGIDNLGNGKGLGWKNNESISNHLFDSKRTQSNTIIYKGTGLK